MDLGDHQQVREETYKTVALCAVLILCISIPTAICINQYLHCPKEKGRVEAFQFNHVHFYDAVSECAPEAQSIDLLNSCVVERIQRRSFPFLRLFYVLGSFLFLGVTLQLNLAQVSMLVWTLILLCDFVIIFTGGV